MTPDELEKLEALLDEMYEQNAEYITVDQCEAVGLTAERLAALGMIPDMLIVPIGWTDIPDA